jgi:hypothetical protein
MQSGANVIVSDGSGDDITILNANLADVNASIHHITAAQYTTLTGDLTFM